MSTNSDATTVRRLCYCGVPARVRYAWTTSNSARKWYGCENYKRDGDCDFFAWANNEMSPYEVKVMEHFKRMEDRHQADIDRLEQLIETKCNDQYVRLRQELGLHQSNWKMSRAVIVVVILLLVFYLSGYGQPRGTYLMLN
ncbi:uncharacterized protein LOC133881430 [Alnus glutinosa]|uniref:uncharacterized protein LOC133851065 n=1 Tax=Alnus glutinosa TaxID=3517 RepID=UPI002D79FA94|nr:uncharacterized protein LOC133851065 [Alnus glutinosa]XP_062163434.1 uncharacterized protein LOC133870353 [Alnus glutinosa]XP_062176344.1 uncharacterized protein LOC133881430 [Alnus glutinosa]